VCRIAHRTRTNHDLRVGTTRKRTSTFPVSRGEERSENPLNRTLSQGYPSSTRPAAVLDDTEYTMLHSEVSTVETSTAEMPDAVIPPVRCHRNSVDSVLVIALLIPVAYLVGTFPSAVLIARSRGVDITASGSGNPGASNVNRLMGKRLGILVFVLDGLKGSLSVVAGYFVAGYAGALTLLAAAILGHVFPVTRKFKGGKGVATTGGGVLTLYPLIGLAMLALWLSVTKVSKKASLGSLAIAIGFPCAQLVVGRPLGEILAGVGISMFMIWRHVPNMKRIWRGDELSVSRQR